jgi:hypothetical protein
MTAAPASPDKLKALELLEAQAEEIKYLVDTVSQLVDLVTPLTETLARIQAAVTRPAAAPAGSQAEGMYRPIDITEIVMTYDPQGRPAYSAKGGQYQKFGVRIWPETLAALRIDPATLKPGPNPITRQAHIEMRQVTDDAGEVTWKPRKIVHMQGANPQPAAPANPVQPTYEDIPF